MARVGLVLGAGGIVGHAFHAGVLSALHQALGWDPRDADVVVGTSAGSGVGAALRAGLAPADLAARASGEPLSDEGERIVARMGPPAAVAEPLVRRVSAFPVLGSPRLLVRKAIRPWRLRMGSAIAGALPEGRLPTEPMVAGIRRVFGDAWPPRSLWICAVRLADGRRVVFGRDAVEASVADAVAASCAIPGYFMPVEIDGARYMDGGAHSPTNADVLARSGLDLVIVVSPMSTAPGVRRVSLDFPTRVLCRMRLVEEATKVRLRGARVVAFEPTASDQEVMGLNHLDSRKRRPVVLAARESTLRRLERTEIRERLASLA